jgi:hypothetical protein
MFHLRIRVDNYSTYVADLPVAIQTPLLQMVPPFFLNVSDTYLQQWFTCLSQVDTLLYLCPYSVGLGHMLSAVTLVYISFFHVCR